MMGLRFGVGVVVFGLIGAAGCALSPEEDDPVGVSQDAVSLTLSPDAEDDPVIGCWSGACPAGKVCEDVGGQPLCVTPCDEGPNVPDCKKPSAKCFDGIPWYAPRAKGKPAPCKYVFNRKKGKCIRRGSPLIVDLSGEGIALSAPEHGVRFDLFAAKTPVRTAWPEKPNAARFLVHDRNGDGRISGDELFGNNTPDGNGRTSENGFLALAAFDANGDGVIDKNDPIYRELGLWADTNRDGEARAEELTSLADAGVVSIALRYAESSKVDSFGNGFSQQASIQLRDGQSRAVVDVWLANDDD